MGQSDVRHFHTSVYAVVPRFLHKGLTRVFSKVNRIHRQAPQLQEMKGDFVTNTVENTEIRLLPGQERSSADKHRSCNASILTPVRMTTNDGDARRRKHAASTQRGNESSVRTSRQLS